MQNVITAVKIIMAEKGLRQKEVASKMNISEKKLSNIMTGRKVIDIPIIRSLCTALGVTPNELFMYKKQ